MVTWLTLRWVQKCNLIKGHWSVIGDQWTVISKMLISAIWFLFSELCPKMRTQRVSLFLILLFNFKSTFLKVHYMFQVACVMRQIFSWHVILDTWLLFPIDRLADQKVSCPCLFKTKEKGFCWPVLVLRSPLLKLTLGHRQLPWRSFWGLLLNEFKYVHKYSCF